MEPGAYIEYFEDTILSRTPKLGQKGCYAKVSLGIRIAHLSHSPYSCGASAAAAHL